MWFVFLGVGLLLVTISGLYARRRIARSLAEVGVSAKRIRILRWVMAWLLFGCPLIIFVAIPGSVLAGSETMPRFEGMVGSWLLVVPFVWMMLVVIQALPWLIAIDLLALRKPRIRAIATLAVVAVFALYTPLRVLVQRGDLRVRHHELGAGTGTPFRIAFVADMQQDVHTDSKRAREVYGLINAEQPTLVLSGGDWINNGAEYIEEAAVDAATLKSPLGTFSVRGDHEHFVYFDRERSVREIETAMERHGVTMLANDVRWFTHEGKRIAVLFVNYNYVVRTPPPLIDALLTKMDGADYKIVVTHQFDAKLAAVMKDKVDLVLGAHTHGGQVNPVLGVTHVQLARLETTFVDGRYQLGRTTVIVTAGVGYSLVPIRYAAPSSIEILDLKL